MYDREDINFSHINEEKNNYEAFRELIREKKARIQEMRDILSDIQKSLFISDKH